MHQEETDPGSNDHDKFPVFFSPFLDSIKNSEKLKKEKEIVLRTNGVGTVCKRPLLSWLGDDCQVLLGGYFSSLTTSSKKAPLPVASTKT